MLKSINPHDPSDVIFEFEPAGSEGVHRAVAAGAAAFEEWSARSAAERGAALLGIGAEIERRAEELTELTVREVGKPVGEAKGEVARAMAICRYYSQMVLGPDGETYPASDRKSWLIARRHPLGVCALITPWNFPIAIPIWKAIPAVGYGNAVVLKPAPQSSAIADVLAEIFHSCVPPGVFQLTHGDAETGRSLVDHEDVAAVSFTGSVTVGHEVAARAAARGAKTQCEMGGQNPSIVLRDADLEAAAKTIAGAAMGYAGQKCTATSRIIVEAPVYEEFRDRLVAEVEALEVVDPTREACRVGPLIEEEAVQQATDALGSGGRTLVGGKRLDASGFYLQPALVEVEDRSHVLARREVFAPVAAVMRAEDRDQAVEIANGVRYGLVAAVFTQDLAGVLDVSGRLEAGLVRANAPTSGVDFHVPFGGIKGSSIGPREQGLAARDFYTESRTLLISP